LDGCDQINVSEVAPKVQRMFGVALSVYGGEPHTPHVIGTESFSVSGVMVRVSPHAWRLLTIVKSGISLRSTTQVFSV
jgi:hypothetical protein